MTGRLYAGRLTAAQRGFSDCAREAKQGVIPLEKCVLYRALLSGFLSNPGSGEEEEILIALRASVKAPDDLVTLATVLYLLKEKKPGDAAKYLSVSLFSEIPYRTLSEAAVALAERDYPTAKKHLFVTLGYRLPLPIECYCLSLLEKCAAAEKDFESAYSFLARRRERLSEMT